MSKNKKACGRCGVRTSAEFCRDCRWVDPYMCAGGKSSRQVTAATKARRDTENEFNREMRWAAGDRRYSRKVPA